MICIIAYIYIGYWGKKKGGGSPLSKYTFLSSFEVEAISMIDV